MPRTTITTLSHIRTNTEQLNCKNNCEKREPRSAPFGFLTNANYLPTGGVGDGVGLGVVSVGGAVSVGGVG